MRPGLFGSMLNFGVKSGLEGGRKFIDNVKLCDEDVDLGLDYTLSTMLDRHARHALATVPPAKPGFPVPAVPAATPATPAPPAAAKPHGGAP